jgi:hypothetical protein
MTLKFTMVRCILKKPMVVGQNIVEKYVKFQKKISGTANRLEPTPFARNIIF